MAERFTFLMYEKDKSYIFIITPLGFLLSWFLVKKYGKFAKGSGIPQVMAALELDRPKDQKYITRLLSLRIIAVKTLSSIVKVMGDETLDEH